MEITATGLEKFGTLEDYFDMWFDSRAHLEVAEAIAEDAVIRLEDEVTGPDGKAWDPWSEEYAKTRGPGDKLLYSSGALADSILARAQGTKSVVGSDLAYAKRQQATRPYVGVSDDVLASLQGTLPASFDQGWERVS